MPNTGRSGFIDRYTAEPLPIEHSQLLQAAVTGAIIRAGDVAPAKAPGGMLFCWPLMELGRPGSILLPTTLPRSVIMGMPVKLSDDLVSAARSEAKRAERSITAQIEHWAKLGRAVEAGASYPDVMALKQSGGDLGRAFADESKRAAIHALLERIARSPDRAAVSDRLTRRDKPVFEADEGAPGVLVRVEPDGTRTRGRLVNRRFVPLRETPARRAR